MSKILELIHPYQVKGIKNVQDYLSVLKNITRTLEQKGYKEKMDGILVPVRWSIKKENWVVDRGTLLRRDVEGVSLCDLQYANFPNELKIAARYVLEEFNKNEELNIFCKSLGLKKNETKFIAFEYVCGLTNRINYDIKAAYPIGLFYMHRNKKSNIIDISEEFVFNISKLSNNFKNNPHKKINKSYLFEKFISEIKNIEIVLFIDNNKKIVPIKDLMLENKNIYKDKVNINNKKYYSLSSNLFTKIKKENITNSIYTKIKSDFTLMYINELYGNFIKDALGLINVEGVVVHDKKNNLLYKITGDFYYNTESVINANKKEEKKEPYSNSYNLLPGVF
jgi:hypothetical protein